MEDLATWDVLVGRIKGHWDKALLIIEPYSDVTERFAAGSKLCADNGEKRRLLEIHSAKPKGHDMVADCGLATTAEAEALKGAELFIHPSMRVALPEDEFYIDEVIGFHVVTEAGEDFGEIEEVLETPAHNVYVTPVAMIPAHPDFIMSTDWAEKRLVVKDVPGLRVDAA